MWRTGRRDLRAMALIVALGIPAQAIIGGVTVLTDLNPWVVSFHLLCSLAIIGVAVRLLLSVDAPLPLAHHGPQVVLAWATFAAAWAVLYVGTVVTGSGPHAGDVDTERNGLSPLQVSQLHADLVFLFVGLTLGLLFTVMAVGGNPAARRAVTVLLAVEVAQGSIGFVQYFTDLPVVLVGFHMLGAAVISACVTWVLLRVRRPEAASPGCPSLRAWPPSSSRSSATTDPGSCRLSRHRSVPTEGAGSAARCPGLPASSPASSWCRCLLTGWTRSSPSSPRSRAWGCR